MNRSASTLAVAEPRAELKCLDRAVALFDPAHDGPGQRDDAGLDNLPLGPAHPGIRHIIDDEGAAHPAQGGVALGEQGFEQVVHDAMGQAPRRRPVAEQAADRAQRSTDRLAADMRRGIHDDDPPAQPRRFQRRREAACARTDHADIAAVNLRRPMLNSDSLHAGIVGHGGETSVRKSTLVGDRRGGAMPIAASVRRRACRTIPADHRTK